MNLSPRADDRLWREPEKESWFRFPNPVQYIVFIIVLICVLIGLWYIIPSSHQGYDTVNIPLIQTDPTPYKIKAESQGVPSVKHQDKLVYGRIRSDQAEPVAEHILPDPEPPLPQIKEESDNLKMVEQYAPEELDPDQVTGAIEKEPEGKGSALNSIEDLIDEAFEEKKTPEIKTSKGKTFIQLGSLKSYDLAESEWGRLSKKHSDVLGGLEPVIQKVDLGEEQGIYYRLRTGPFDGPEKATEVCSGLKEQKSECVVIE